jgi:hypothetical protein
MITTETDKRQELRARQQLNPKALIRAALIAGVVTFIFPGGGPWMSHEFALTAMGRVMSPNWFVDVVVHCILSVLYGWIIAAIIYSLPIGGGILMGAALFLPFYLVNWLLFGKAMGYPANELHVGIAHLIFALFFSVAYKAMAIPKQRPPAPERPHAPGTIVTD